MNEQLKVEIEADPMIVSQAVERMDGLIKTYEGFEEIRVALVKGKEQSFVQCAIYNGDQILYASEGSFKISSDQTLPSDLSFNRYLIL